MKLVEALATLRAAEKALKKKKTYENAVELQRAQRNFEIERQNAIRLLKEEDVND